MYDVHSLPRYKPAKVFWIIANFSLGLLITSFSFSHTSNFHSGIAAPRQTRLFVMWRQTRVSLKTILFSVFLSNSHCSKNNPQYPSSPLKKKSKCCAVLQKVGHLFNLNVSSMCHSHSVSLCNSCFVSSFHLPWMSPPLASKNLWNETRMSTWK